MKPRYFTHDFDAGRDSKILKMRSDKWGLKGVGLYWLTIEFLFSTDGKARLDELELAAIHIGEKFSLVKQFCEDCINKYDLFSSDGEYFWSNRLLLELENAKRKSYRAKENALKKYSTKNSNCKNEKEIVDSQAKSTLSDSLATAQPQLSHSSAKKRKKEKKEDKDTYGEFSNVYLLDSEYEKCVQKNGEQLTLTAIEYLSSYKASEGKSYKSDYAALCRWGFNAVIKKNPNFWSSQESHAPNVFTPRLIKSVWDDEDLKEEVL